MARHSANNQARAASRSAAPPPDYPIYRTRDWLGRERLLIRANGRRYLYRTLDQALRGRAKLWRLHLRRANGLPSRRRRPLRMLARGTAVIAIAGVLAISWYPPLLLQVVDQARAVVGPAPVAYAETLAFRLRTLVRRAEVGLGATAPRWTLEDAPEPAARVPAAPGAKPTSPAAARPLPATTPLPTATTSPSTPTVEPIIGAGTIMRGGNLRSAPRIAGDTVVGLVWPGDQVALLERRNSGAQRWLRVQIDRPAANRAGAGVDAGRSGWISGVLLSAPAPTPAPTAPPRPKRVPPPAAPPAVTGAWPPAPLAAPIDDGQLPGEGQWHLLPAMGDGGSPSMAATTLRPDPTRPDIQVAIVAVDMTRARLHMVAGTEEPPGAPEVARPGAIPAEIAQSGTLLAAFNGGFKAIHGSDGMGVDGVTYLAPVRNRATIAVTADGAVRMGLWGRDFQTTDNLVAWRQNGHLLVDGGQVTDRARQSGLGWGASVDLQAETWRSAVGISADGNTLFYAVGDGLTAARLAEVMRAAGAWSALQLDINNYYVRFVTYRLKAGGVVARPLISAMLKEGQKFLVPEKRDFMYLTTR